MIERTKDSSKDLDEALKNLDQLTNRLKTDGLLSIDLSSGAIQTQTPSLLKKGVQLTSQFFSSVFSPKNTQLLEQRQAQIRRWVDTVKSHFDDLEAWRQGSPKERKKAAQVLTTARRYNAVLSRLQKEPQGWFNRIGQALSFGAELRDSFIPLPRRTQRRRHFTHAQGSRVSTPALSQLRQLPPKRIEPTRRELEAFRMKASTLIRQHTAVEHAADALAVVRSHPV
ncbi:MAG: hypothetical protein KDK78_01290, partial [Chlamydiia bacterium]|nr:hypothetical protein [Chlamydiia bacterium]